MTTSAPGTRRALANATSPKPSPPRGPSAWEIDIVEDAYLCAPCGEIHEARIERGDLIGRRAFLWAEDTGCAAIARERVVHVPRSDDVEPFERVCVRRLDARDGVEVVPDGFDGFALRIKESEAERSSHADAAIDGAAAAEADNDSLAACVSERDERFANATRGKYAGIAIIRENKVEAHDICDGEEPRAYVALRR